MNKIPYEDFDTVQAILNDSEKTTLQKATEIHQYAYDYVSMAGDWRDRKNLPSVEKIHDILVERER